MNLPADDGISIRYRTDGDFFNIRSRRTKKATISIIDELLYADDVVFGRHTRAELQRQTERLKESCKKWGLTIIQEKTEVLHQQCVVVSPVTLENKPLTVAHKFCYLGGTVSDDCQLDKEISQRVSKASQAFYSLRSKVWNRNGITLRTKLLVYHAIIKLTLLYGSETWTTHVRHFRKIECFQQRCLLQLTRIKWQDKISNIKLKPRVCDPY